MTWTNDPLYHPQPTQLENERIGDIIFVYEYPPIPIRDFDWCAYHDGEEETGHYGWGKTKEEALEDLRRLDEERTEFLHGEGNEEIDWEALKP